MIDGSRSILTTAFWAVYQFENAFVLMASSCRPSGVRFSSAKTLNRYVPSPVIETMLLVLPTSAAKIASVRRVVELVLGDPAEVAALAGGLGLGVVAGQRGEVRPAVGIAS